MSQPYCGKCHKWLDSLLSDDEVCRCANPDLTKDPNCHNSGHDHYDPESPIVKMDRQVAAVEDAIDSGRAHEWLDYGEGQYCAHCDMDAADLKGDAWVYCPARPPQHRGVAEIAEIERTRETVPPDNDYDAHRINWPRLAERILSSTYNAIFYGSLLVAAKLLGLM